MSEESPLPHGGALDDATQRFGDPAGGWLDLSTGINPAPYPDTAIGPDSLARLPQQAAMDALLAAARACYRVPDGLDIAAAPGSQALLQVLPARAPGGAVAVLGPTYAEHERLWRQSGRVTRLAESLNGLAAAAIAVIVNPNNPDGRITPPGAIRDLARKKAGGGLVVVDEAFADLDPKISVVPCIRDEPVLVLRSFGKFFGLAGLRLGFAIGPPCLIHPLRSALGPWPVSGPALDIGARALADEDWIAATRTRLRARREDFDRMLTAAGLEVTGGTDLFRLVQDANAATVHERLGRAGIFTRIFIEQPTWIRLGVPQDDATLARVRRVLEFRI